MTARKFIAKKRLSDIVAWRAERISMAEIGRRLGVTREYIRQVCTSSGIQQGQRWPIPRFALRMKRWLWSAGYRRCCTCGIWSDKVTKTVSVCPKCNRAQAAAWHGTEKGKRYVREYARTHPEVVKRAKANYRQKLRSNAGGMK